MYFSFSTINELILAIILGIVQGVTEFLPISSTAHLLLFSKYLTKASISLAASNVIQFGTFIAIVQYFWEDVKTLSQHIFKRLTDRAKFKQMFINIKNWFQDPSQLFDLAAKQDILLSQIVIATIPVIISALILRNYLESMRESLYYVAIFLTLGGILIVYAELMHIKKLKTTKPRLMSFKETLTIGLFQSLAIFPGVSRSGSALAGGLFLGRNREESVKFSFLLSLPALGLASAYDVIKVIGDFRSGKVPLFPTQSSWTTAELGLSVISITVSFIVAYFMGLVCLKFLLKYLAKNDSKVFVLYRIVLVLFIIFTFNNLR